MWTSEKQALAMKQARSVPSAKRSNVKTSGCWGKATPTFYVQPPVFKYTPGKVTLIKGQGNSLAR